jgi:predicted Rdx family selenoprotein
MNELIELLSNYDYFWRMSDDQRKWDAGYENEKRIKQLMRDYVWDDIDPYIKEEWKKEAIKSIL